jgi:hypothetical protein
MGNRQEFFEVLKKFLIRPMGEFAERIGAAAQGAW